MNKLLKLSVAIPALAIVLLGCSKPTLSGLYVNEKDPKDTMQFHKDGTWTSDNGGSGTYTIEGKTVMIRGALGLTMPAVFSGDTIVITDTDMATGKPMNIIYKKK